MKHNAHRKPGRKRKADAKRHPSGRIHYETNRDHGTPELQARRLFLANGKDMALTTYPLGIMLANEVIDEDMHAAGCKFAWLHAILYGRASVTAQKFSVEAVGKDVHEPDEAWLCKRKADWNDACAVLKSLSRQHYDAIVSAAVYERVPGFLKPKLQTGRDVKHGRLIVEGLAGLARGRFDKRCEIA